MSQERYQNATEELLRVANVIEALRVIGPTATSALNEAGARAEHAAQEWKHASRAARGLPELEDWELVAP